MAFEKRDQVELNAAVLAAGTDCSRMSAAIRGATTEQVIEAWRGTDQSPATSYAVMWALDARLTKRAAVRTKREAEAIALATKLGYVKAA